MYKEHLFFNVLRYLRVIIISTHPSCYLAVLHGTAIVRGLPGVCPNFLPAGNLLMSK